MTRPNSQNSVCFAQVLARTGLDTDPAPWIDRLNRVTVADVEKALNPPHGLYSPQRLLALISPAARAHLEPMAQAAHRLTVQRFGRTIKLYAPLYVSNVCINSCLYCGFNTDSNFERTRLTVDQALAEARVLADYGFKDILLVSGEDPRHVTVDYLCELANRLRPQFSSISAEIYPLTASEYARLFAAGIEGVTLYQETYHRPTYAHFHPAGPKSDYDYRLAAAERMAAAGMRELGIGALLGLNDWRIETLALAAHADYLMKKYWKSHISISFPRLRPANDVGKSIIDAIPSDRELTQMILALRLCFADAGLVLSTRESADLRNHLIKLGITRISAGSRTNPGGYAEKNRSTEQFQVSDDRGPAEMAAMLKQQGFDPVWKDWDRSFLGS